MSEFHFNRIFAEWAGLPPKRFMQFLKKEQVKEILEKSPSLLDTAYAANLSGTGRLHDLLITTEAVSDARRMEKRWCKRNTRIRIS